jgi:uncharacterized membrane protein
MQNPSAFGDATVKSSTGLDANIAALLAYLLGLLGGLIFFFIEKNSRFVKFHAMQSILFNVVVGVVAIVLTIVVTILTLVISSISSSLGFIVSMLSLVFWLGFGLVIIITAILLLIKAFQGQMFKLPIIGNMAEKFASK